MTTAKFAEDPKRWQEIIEIWRDNRWLYVVAGLVLGLLLTPALEQLTGDFYTFIGNLVPEAIGIVFTVLILERLAENRQRENYKQNLIRQAGSIVNDIAVDAIEQLRKEGWLTGERGVLRGANLTGANLDKARLEDANLQHTDLGEASLVGANLKGVSLKGANLVVANLQGANLSQANLQDAYLSSANLQAAVLQNANLQRADLAYSDLHEANLTEANLQQANLQNANLQHAHLPGANLQHALLRNANFDHAYLINANLRDAQELEEAQFTETTVLPDAQLFAGNEAGMFGFDKYWTRTTDMLRYTNPRHPDFWQPDWAKE